MAAPPGLSEDDLYRSSTQYKYWSFTPSSLAAQRTTTNRLAAARVRDAIRRARHKTGTHDASTSEEVDCLTEEEELKIIRFYCEQTMALADFCELPSNIKVCIQNSRKMFNEPC
jgi:cyclin H